MIYIVAEAKAIYMLPWLSPRNLNLVKIELDPQNLVCLLPSPVANIAWVSYIIDYYGEISHLSIGQTPEQLKRNEPAAMV